MKGHSEHIVSNLKPFPWHAGQSSIDLTEMKSQRKVLTMKRSLKNHQEILAQVCREITEIHKHVVDSSEELYWSLVLSFDFISDPFIGHHLPIILYYYYYYY